MTLIICIDDNGGMMFNKRRVSRDKALTQELIRITEPDKLYIRPYSQLLFKEFEGEYVLVNDFSECPENASVLVEDVLPSALAGLADKVILCRWNRRYPSDMKTDLDMSVYALTETYDMVGNSHEKITIEKYTRS